MSKYTREMIECSSCFKKNNFHVEVIEQQNAHYYLTRCPKCGSYDEVKKLSSSSPHIKARQNKDE